MRRRRSATDSQSLDSLLDTMANVIGILVVILAVTQISVGEAMKRIRAFDALEAEQERQARIESALLQDELDSLQARWDELAPEEMQVERAGLSDDLRRLRAEPAALQLASQDPADLARTLAREQAAAQRLEDRVATSSAQLASLRISLKKMPDVGTAKTVRLPDPRPAPRGTVPAVFFARYGYVFWADLENLKARLIDELLRNPRSSNFPDIGTRALRWQPLPALRGRPGARLVWRQRANGDSAETVGEQNSAFRKALGQLHPKQHVVQFYVWPDSYDAYLRAREIAEGYGFHAGWEAYELDQESDWYQTDRAQRQAVPID